MAEKTFGYTATTEGTYAGSAYSHGVGMAWTMPEKGKIIAIRLKLATYAAATHPKIWGMIWNRTSGAILSQSAGYVSPTNVYVNASDLDVFEIAMPGTIIAAGALLLIGFAKDSSGANLAPWWGLDNSATGYTWYEDNGSNATPVAFVVAETHSNAALYAQVVYETGGQIKVFGASFVAKPAKVWNGASWLAKPVKIWDGTIWKESNS